MKMSDERGEFEKSWGRAFENARITPPESVWNKIEEDLDASDKKRGFFFLKLAVAASLVFASSLALYQVFMPGNSVEEIVTAERTHEDTGRRTIEPAPGKIGAEQENGATNSLPPAEETATSLAHRQEATHKSGVESESRSELAQSAQSGNSPLTSDSADFFAEQEVAPDDFSTATTVDNTGNLPVFLASEADMAYLSKQGIGEWISAPGEPEPIEFYPQGYDLIASDKKRRDAEPALMAGLNFSTGLFDPGVSDQAVSNRINQSQSFARTAFAEYNSGINSVNDGMAINEVRSYEQAMAYSYGANVGYKLGRKFILLGGINYVRASSQVNSNMNITQNGERIAQDVVVPTMSNNGNFQTASQNKLDVSNALEFASVPLKAGYLIWDRKLNLTVLTGVSADFLLGSSYRGANEFSTMYADNMKSQNSVVYDDVYVNGILGLNVGYVFARHYRLSIEPSMRQSLNSLINDNDVSSPVFKMLSFGLSYQF